MKTAVAEQVIWIGGSDEDLVKNYLAFLEKVFIRTEQQPCKRGISSDNNLSPLILRRKITGLILRMPMIKAYSGYSQQPSWRSNRYYNFAILEVAMKR